MERGTLFRRPRMLAATVVAVALAAAAAAGGTAASPRDHGDRDFVQHNLVSDGFVPADHTDANLVNAWGLVQGPGTPFWVADNGTDVSTLYDGAGNAMTLVVHVDGGPTGTVFNGGSGFVVTDGTNSGPAKFLFASEDGKIRGWSPAVPPPPPSTQSFVGADRSSVGAIYKGLAIASTSAGDRLYATDFHNARVDVFDSSFQLVSTPGAFTDPRIPRRFAPFGIQNIGGRIFVTYAKQDANAEDDVHGRGLGFVDVFDTSGAMLGRVASRGQLNAPWGLAMAPSGFGRASGDLLVGNFGDGRINVFEAKSHGRFEPHGQLRRDHGHALRIDGLWALQFGNGAAGTLPQELFFTAGPADEKHGLFGKITAAGNDDDNDDDSGGGD